MFGAETMKIMFVCTGNICRSPMAEMILRQMTNAVEVTSSGTLAYEGGAISNYSRTVLEKHAVKIDDAFRSKRITSKQLDSSDIVLTMTHEHKSHILRLYPEYEDKVWVLTEYVEPTKAVDVDDPYGFPYESYEEVYQQLKVLLEKIIEKLGL